MTAAAIGSAAILPGRGGIGGALSDAFWRNPKLLLLFMLTPPLLWLGIIYLGSLFRAANPELLFDRRILRLVVREFTLKTYGELLRPSNLDIIVRTVTMAALVTIASAIIAFPIAYFRRALCPWPLEGLVLSRRDAATVVELSGQGLCLEADPGQGRHPQLALREAAPDLSDRCLACPAGGWRQLAVGQPDRHVSGLRLCLAAVHDPACAGSARAGAGQSA
jgi:hypothetical protein